MSQILKPKPLPENPFQEVELIYGSEHRWKVPNKFSFSLRGAFFKIPYDRCFEWLTAEMKKKPTTSGREPSMIDNGIGAAIASTLQTQMIPDDNQLDKYVNRFLYNRDIETRKSQLDVICIPVGSAPKASEILEQADEETVESVFSYFFDLVNPKTPQSDSGVSEKASGLTTEEGSS